MSEHDDREAVGSLGEEAARLMDALAGWAREQGHEVGDGVSGLADAAVDAARRVDDHLATGAEECRWCPVCRVVHAVRETSPEVRAHLATAATSLLHAAAGLVATTVPRDEEPGSRIEHIGVDGPGDPLEDEDGEDWEDQT